MAEVSQLVVAGKLKSGGYDSKNLARFKKISTKDTKSYSGRVLGLPTRFRPVTHV